MPHRRTCPITVVDYWRWVASDLMGNVNRGTLAEYVVAAAITDVAAVVPPPLDASAWELLLPGPI